ncbi:uncharacterized protein LOC108739603 isoform X2 [Agrilus planipennis]|uniref:Uncharacterized protein LOC108739603 isoform X2 n=1 Tax=Agrilus planipennis TaxID=224129 RepID=A0A1W4X9L3_AGRPL|nr:uncharacterized protein LOC108739603 isoform X2 [Agrilus planipennis]
MAVNTAYTLVLFVDDKKDNGDLESIDMVPSFWLKYDEEDDCLKCPCYDNVTIKNKEIFSNAVRNLQPPPTTWSFHRVEIRGYSNTYAIGLQRLDKLQVKRFAFTTDDTDNDEEKQKSIEKRYRLKGSKTSGKKVEKLLSECQKHFVEKTNDSNEVQSKDVQPMKPKNKDNFAEIIDGINKMQTAVLDRFNKLSHQVGTLQSEILKIKAEIQQSKNSMPAQHSLANLDGIYQIEGYDIAFENLSDFEKFDKDLKNNAELRQKCISIMYPCLNLSAKPMESILKIAKKFLKKEVLEFYTAIKERKGKKIFKTTSFYSCLYDVIISEFAKTSSHKINENQFQKDIGKMINNSKDWDGGRKDRDSKEKPQQNEDSTRNKRTISSSSSSDKE